MARSKKAETKRPVSAYEHRDKEHLNNPPAGLVTPETDPDAGQNKKTYAYDPHAIIETVHKRNGNRNHIKEKT